MKLRQELRNQIEELERNRTDTIPENSELKTEVARLRHDIEEIRQQTQVIIPKDVNIPSYVNRAV
jgi:phage shock protein A